jgi:hypothetical protein
VWVFGCICVCACGWVGVGVGGVCVGGGAAPAARRQVRGHALGLTDRPLSQGREGQGRKEMCVCARAYEGFRV